MEIEINKSFESAAELVRYAKRNIEELSSKKSICGIPTGFEKFDQLTNGLQPSDLIVIASRPSMGKSSFALSMIRNASIDFGKTVALFSSEMSLMQIMNRFISLETGLSLAKLKSGKLENYEWELLSIKTKSLENAKLYIEDIPSLTIQQLSESARTLVNELGVEMIVIDNLHLLSCGSFEKLNFTREQELSTIIRILKHLAKELNIPIVLLAQLSREIEYRGNHKRPILNDLRGSGTIEEVADIVSFIYRPEYYKIEEWDDDEQSLTNGQAEFIIAKHRNGSLDNIRLSFNLNKGEFDNLHYSFENLPTKINDNNNPFITKNLPSANEAFGSNINSNDDDSDVPF